MSATIESSLYIGITKTRFDQFDEVKLKLKNKQIVQGVIEDFGQDNTCLTLETDQGKLIIVAPLSV